MINTLYARCQTKDYILDIVAARAGMRTNKVNSIAQVLYFYDLLPLIVNWLMNYRIIEPRSMGAYLCADYKIVC